MDPTSLTSITFLVGNLVGSIFKNNVTFNTKFIPGLVFVAQLVVNGFMAGIGIDLNSTPQVAILDPIEVLFPMVGESEIAMAGFWGSLGGAFKTVFIKTIVDTLLAVGLHSTAKNAKQGMNGEG